MEYFVPRVRRLAGEFRDYDFTIPGPAGVFPRSVMAGGQKVVPMRTAPPAGLGGELRRMRYVQPGLGLDVSSFLNQYGVYIGAGLLALLLLRRGKGGLF